MGYVFKNPLKVEGHATDIRNLGDLAEEMVYRLPGCADLMIRKELQRTWSDFATRTRILRIPFKIELKSGCKNYIIPLDMDASIDRLINMHLAFEDETGITSSDDKEFFYRDWNFLRTLDYEPAIALNFKVDSNFLKRHNRIFGTAECLPKIGSEDIPAWIYDRFGRAIAEGAMKSLLSMQGKPWADPAQAQQSLIVYENALNDAIMPDMENSRGEVDVTNREGWA